MPAKVREEDVLRRVHRGGRVAEIRKALELTGEELAALLDVRLGAFGVVHPVYDRSVISRIESGRRDVSLEEGVMLAELDPYQRGHRWLAFGELPENYGRRK